MHKSLVPVCAVFLLAGCASFHEPVPQGYAGATAKVSDQAIAEDAGKARVYALAAIDGKRIDNAIFATRRASSGRGFAIATHTVERLVPAMPMRVKLIATHQTAAPIHEMASRAQGTFHSVEGEVDFNPVDGGVYVVNGDLQKGASAVWIEDAKTRAPVTEKVVQRP